MSQTLDLASAEMLSRPKPAPRLDQNPRITSQRENRLASKARAQAGVPAIDPSKIIPDSSVSQLRGHSSDVFAVSWNPKSATVASGSGDGTARIWQVPPVASGPAAAQTAMERSTVLDCVAEGAEGGDRDVTTLDWNIEGTLLATGSYDGKARIWTDKGELKATLEQHTSPIFSVKWNAAGNYLLSGSVDKTAIVWDVETGAVKQQFSFHQAPTLDVDWRNNASFASCSTDNMIYVCKVGEERPIKAFSGHGDEINAIKWNPSGQLLASCSDDATAKIWSLANDRPVHDLTEHTRELHTVRWSPTGAGSANPNASARLATASFDATVKLWDPEVGKALNTLEKHTEAVYSVAFSPNGEYIATGSSDKNLHIWSVRDGSCVKSYFGKGGIFEVSWNAAGDKLGVCCTDASVAIMDFRV